MLPRPHRLRRSEDFSDVVRRGCRVGRGRAVVHLQLSGSAPPAVGFVVSKAVGGAVVRNRVERRLREVVRALLPQLPPGTRVVVRALPPAAAASSGDLARDVERALSAALAKAAARAGTSAAGTSAADEDRPSGARSGGLRPAGGAVTA